MRTCGHIQTPIGSVLVIRYSLPITSISAQWSQIGPGLPRMSQTSTSSKFSLWSTYTASISSRVVCRRRIGTLVHIGLSKWILKKLSKNGQKNGEILMKSIVTHRKTSTKKQTKESKNLVKAKARKSNRILKRDQHRKTILHHIRGKRGRLQESLMNQS